MAIKPTEWTETYPSGRPSLQHKHICPKEQGGKARKEEDLMLRHLIIILFIITAAPATSLAQDEPIYRREIGVGIGMTTYLGDFNGSLTKGMQPAASLVYRHNLSVFSAIRADMGFTQLKDSSTNSTTYYPGLADEPYTFKRSMADLNIVYEYNFWPYGTGREYRGAVPLTPYIFGGLGATLATGDPKTTFTANTPLGLGLKYKVSPRLNINLEWAFHASLSDKLDGMESPYGIKSSGIFKNTDCYSTLRLALTYSFSPKCPTCNKDDW